MTSYVMMSLNYDRKCAKKCTNECTNCEVPGRDGESSFIPRYLPILPEDLLTIRSRVFKRLYLPNGDT